MPRHAREKTVIPGWPHHVIIRGNNRRKLFSYPSCRRRFLELLARAAVHLGIPLHALVLMTNHVHLVLTPADTRALAAFMKHFEQRYAVERNRRFASSGKLFEERYYAEPIADEAHLARLIPYVEANPERARLSTADAFPWSTYALHAGSSASRVPRELWTPSEWYLGLGPDDARRSAAYREHFESCRSTTDGVDLKVRGLELVSEVHGHRPRRPDGTMVREERALYAGQESWICR